MKNLSNILAGVGILLVLYSIVGRFVAGATIGCGFVSLPPKSGLLLANSLMLISIVMKQMKK